jgi:hypothetical protein
VKVLVGGRDRVFGTHRLGSGVPGALQGRHHDHHRPHRFPTHDVDVVGVGAGVYDRLAELGVPVTPYNGGEAPFDKERFVNARAEDYWNLREIFEVGEVDIDELDDVLAAQLGSIKWTVDSRGRIKIESKDDMRKRGLPSPDRADTLAMVMSRRATGGPKIDVESHQGDSLTGDLLDKAW